ncbi:polyketide cyclase [Nostoc sp. 3335mG]|nr:polyketide cyclase [Nostoc sp. 3335mG]
MQGVEQMKTHDSAATKRHIIGGLQALARAQGDDIRVQATKLFSSDARYICAHPINQMEGLDEIVGRHLAPLKAAFPDLERRDDILMSGSFDGHDWVSATGYYYGTFRKEWLGLPANGNWTYIRFGEFYKIQAGMIVDAYVILDMVDVMRQIGCNPLPVALGVEGLCPSPATQAGLLLAPQDPEEGDRSLKLAEAMMFEGMRGFDGVDHDTMNFDRYFTNDMMWYGPGGIGSMRGIDGFMERHEIPFNEAWPDFKGGHHKARFGDGLFVCSTGWPSIYGTHTGGSWLGLAPTQRKFEMRVMDWWRREGDWLIENWVFIDIPHLFMQFDRDLFAEARSIAARRS